MNTVFQHWTDRATDGTGDLFWLGKELLASKDEVRNRQWFKLTVFNPQSELEELLDHQFFSKQGWKNAYRLARVAIRMGVNNGKNSTDLRRL